MLGLAVVAVLAISVPTLAQDAVRVEAGRQVWVNGGCSGCHGARGQGSESPDRYPPTASMRATELDRDGLIEAISCGRPGSEMRAWLEGAYTDSPCYGLDLGPAPARTMEAGVFEADEIEALVDYLMADIVGK